MDLPSDMDLFAGLGDAKHFYFAHSFCAEVADVDAKVAFADYGFDLTASVQKGNIYGTQFHPEKSGKYGLEILRNFYDICLRTPPSTKRKRYLIRNIVVIYTYNDSNTIIRYKRTYFFDILYFVTNLKFHIYSLFIKLNTNC